MLVIGAGPAGITVSDGLLRAGATVILAESGGLEEEAAAEELSAGVARGPLIKRHEGYLSGGRRRRVGGSATAWGPGFCMPFRELDFQRRPWVELSGWPLERSELAPYETLAAATFAFEPFPRPTGRGAAPATPLSLPAGPAGVSRASTVRCSSPTRVSPRSSTQPRSASSSRAAVSTRSASPAAAGARS